VLFGCGKHGALHGSRTKAFPNIFQLLTHQKSFVFWFSVPRFQSGISLHLNLKLSRHLNQPEIAYSPFFVFEFQQVKLLKATKHIKQNSR